MATYPTLKVVKELLRTHGLAPNKRLGQNFLVDANIARKSLELAAIKQGDTIVEIGPGLGALTQLLLEAGCKVYAVEKDNGFYRYLNATIVPQYESRLNLMHADAMDHPLAALDAPAGEFKIVANLPYAISTPWLDEVLSGPLPSHLVLMLQKEAANRFIANPGTGNYGPISLFLNSAYEVKAIHSVGTQCFYPKPEVGSALLSLERIPAPCLFEKAIKDGIRQIFRQRRKQIGSLVAKLDLDSRFKPWLNQLIASGMSPDTRPEAIPMPEWQLLGNR